MKNIYEVLRQKEQQSEQLHKEIDALRIAIEILNASDVAVSPAKTNGNGAIAEPAMVASAAPAKRFP
jgi:prefoldin subunit 5